MKISLVSTLNYRFGFLFKFPLRILQTLAAWGIQKIKNHYLAKSIFFEERNFFQNNLTYFRNLGTQIHPI
jgi:hypothetical protein